MVTMWLLFCSDTAAVPRRRGCSRGPLQIPSRGNSGRGAARAGGHPVHRPALSTCSLPCRALPSLAAQGKMNKMKNFKRRFSLSVPRTETIEESLTEFTEQFNQLNNRRNEGKEPLGPYRGAGAGREHLGSGLPASSSTPAPRPFSGCADVWKVTAPLSVLLSPSIQQN